MKNITSFFKNINIKSVFITLVLIFNINFSYSQVDLRTCGFDCTSNNYTLTDVYLSLAAVNGDPITNTTCTIGQVQPVYIYLNYSSNSNATIHFTRLNSDLTINGVTTFLNVLLGDVVPGSNKKLLYGPFNWVCGEDLSLTNTIIAWKTSANNDPGPNYNCGSFSNAQCDFTNSFIISKPLAVQFTYKACKVGTNTTVAFTSTTNGGITPYTYAWDFRNDGGAPDSTSPNPTFTYTTSNNTAKLTVTDSQNLTNSYIVPIIEPDELMLSETHPNVGCSGGTTTITLTPTGGTPNYTYLWNTGAVTKDLPNVGPGTYTVTVTDSNNCTKQLSVTVTSGDLTNPVVDPLPAPSTINCPDTPVFAVATATDNSGTVSSLTFVDVNTPGACVGTYSITRTWTAKDACDNASLPVSQTINVVDTTAPAWTTAPTALNVTLQCSNTAGLAAAQSQAPVATDACSAVSYNKISGGFVAGSCANSGTYTNTWEAKDLCLNTSTTFTQIITIEDTTPPAWTTAPTALNVTLECSDTAGLATAQSQAPVATDNCNGTVTYSKISGSFVAGSCINSGTYTNTWEAKDVCLNTSTTFTQVITIEDTTPPSWTTAATALNVTLECSDTAGLATAQSQAPVATDNCNGTVTYTKTSGSFVAGSCVNSGTYTNTWKAKDVCLNTSTTFTQVITIEDTTPPAWTTAATDLNVTLQCSNAAGLATAQSQAPVATDNCNGTVTYTKTSGSFVAGSCANSGTYTNTWKAKDVCLNTSTTFTQVITIEDTTPPSWTTAATALNVTLQCSNTAGLATAQSQAPVATDNCNGTVTYTKTSGAFVAGSCVNSGTYTNTWVAKDICLNASTTFTQVITIEDTTAPTWTTAATDLNVTLQCSDTAGLNNAQSQAPVATDNCSTVTYNKVSGQFQRGICGSTGTYTNTWTAKDVCNNTSTVFTQVITVQDTAIPTWITQAGSLDITLQCSDANGLLAAQSQAPSATANCSIVTYTKTSGQFIASQSCSNSGTYTNTWVAEDDCGNITSAFTQVITIEDTTKPTFVESLPADVTVSCDAVPAAAEITASDNCNTNLPVVYTETKSGIQNACDTNYTLTRTWTTSDCSNNTTSYTQIITVRDTTPPTGTVPADITDLQSIADIPVADSGAITDAADNCSQTVTITVTDTNNGASGCEGNAYILTRTYTLSDCAGNQTILVQTITVENKVSVSGIPTPASCQGLSDGSIAITNSPGSTVVVTNANNEVVGNTNLPAGTYTLTATSPVNNDNQNCTATATITITEPNYKVRISGTIMNIETNTPLANVPVTLIPQGTTTGPVLLHLTDANGMYNFQNIPEGDYLLQVQDANLNNVYQLFPVTTSLFFTTLQNCAYQVHNFDYSHSNLPIIGDYVWYDTNSNGIQDEWYDANNDGVVTQNIPDSDNAIEYSKWEWIDFNGDGSYAGAQNIGELNAGGFGNALSPNIFITGPNGYHKEIIIGIQGYYRDRPEIENPYGDYAVELKIDGNLDTASQAMGATGLVKVVPNFAGKKVSGVTGKQQAHIVCGSTNAPIQTATITAEDLIHLDKDFGISCKLFADINAVDDSYVDIGCNKFGIVGNVLSNDLLNEGVPATIEMVNLTLVPNETNNTNANITINESGNVIVLAGTPAGTYTYNYQICEKLNPTNCDSAVVTIRVLPNEVTTVTGTACNADTSPVNLLNLLPAGTPATGTWIDTNNTHAVTGNILTAFGLPLGNYSFEYKIQDELCPRSIVLNLSVNDKCKVLSCGTILVHNAFSPNGDNVNDRFIIDSIDDIVCYPSNTIEIYNRWGILVFETQNYNNTTNAFDGISRGRTTISQSDGLPSGTYFYILNYTSVDGNGAIQTNKKDGYLYLSK